MNNQTHLIKKIFLFLFFIATLTACGGGAPYQPPVDNNDDPTNSQTNIWTSDFGEVRDVVVSKDGSKAYLAVKDFGGLKIVSLLDPKVPKLLGKVVIGGQIAPGKIRSITLAPNGETVYIASKQALTAIDVRDASKPKIAQYFSVTSRIVDPYKLVYDSALSPDSKTLYVSYGFSGGVKLYDVSDPYHATYIASTTKTSGFSVTLSKNGKKVFIGNNRLNSSDLTIFDVADSSAITFLSTTAVSLVDSDNYAETVELSTDEKYAFVGVENEGLRILDIQETSNPYNIGFLKQFSVSHIRDIAVSKTGNVIYLASSDGISVIDIKDKENPKLIETLNTGASYHIDLASDGWIAYVAGSRGFTTIYLSKKDR